MRDTENLEWEQIKNEWVSELRSGAWTQGADTLVSEYYGDNDWRSDPQYVHCCLGVLACMLTESRVSTMPYSDEDGTLLDNLVMQTLGFPSRMGVSVLDKARSINQEKASKPAIEKLFLSDPVDTQKVLATLNDNGFTFLEIADIVEEVL